MPLREFSIGPDDLMSAFDRVLEEIAAGAVFRVIENKECIFVLGGKAACGRVIGLVDAEYGWPREVARADVRTLADIAPGKRSHPFIIDESNVVAVAVSPEEWEQIKRRAP